MKRLVAILVSLALGVSMLHAEVVLPSVFADGMVLQQQADVAFWGKAKPDAKVTITTTWSKTKTLAQADAEGNWSAKVATPAAGGPHEITVSDGKKLTLKDVLIGEVWICSGQSNMEMPLKGFDAQPVEGSAEVILDAKPSVPIRVCKVKRTVSYDLDADCPARWIKHVPTEIGEASAVAYFFAKRLYQTLDVPVGVVVVSVGGSYIEAWMPQELLERDFPGEFDFSHLEKKAKTRAKAHHDPCVLYNKMLLSVMGYTAKGFTWYQGCSNVGNPEQYRRLQPAFVKMLRESWKNSAMPFYYTQIAPHKTNTPEMMWVQALNVYDIPNSAMATTHDIGDYICIHPAKKKEVGDRLAFLALSRDYGYAGAIDAKTPMPINYEFKDGEAIVTFEVGSLGVSPRSTDLDGFELAGEDGVFYPAKGRVLRDAGRDSKAIKVYKCPQVTKPVAVRYAWSRWCPSTLFNCSGIPVTPFNSTIK